jgi:hypothetical protein
MWIDGSTPLQAHDRRIVALIVVGVLIVWMVSDLERLREVLDWFEPYGTRSAAKKQTLVIGLTVAIVLIVTMLMGWWLPDVGPKPQPGYSFSGYDFTH